jgi:hypothetical protein
VTEAVRVSAARYGIGRGFVLLLVLACIPVVHAQAAQRVKPAAPVVPFEERAAAAAAARTSRRP